MAESEWYDDPDGRPSAPDPVFDDGDDDPTRRRRRWNPLPHGVRPPRRMILMGCAAAVAAVMALGVGMASHARRADLDREATRCGQAARDLSSALNARAGAVETAKLKLDMTVLAKADPDMASEVSGIVKAEPARILSCSTDVAAHADRMERAVARTGRETRRLRALTRKATAASGEYRRESSAERFDKALDEAEELYARIKSDGGSWDPWLTGRLGQEIERAKSLPRSSSVNSLDTQSSTLEDLCDQLAAQAGREKGDK